MVASQPSAGLDKASAFFSWESPAALVEEAQAMGQAGIPTGNEAAYIIQTNRMVGILRQSAGGYPTQVYTVIVRGNDTVATLFPGVPSWFKL